MDRGKTFVRIYVARFLTRLQSLTPHVIASTSKAFFYRKRTKMSLFHTNYDSMIIANQNRKDQMYKKTVMTF